MKIIYYQKLMPKKEKKNRRKDLNYNPIKNGFWSVMTNNNHTKNGTKTP